MAASTSLPESCSRQRRRDEGQGGSRKNIKGAKVPGDRGAHGGSGEFFEGWLRRGKCAGLRAVAQETLRTPWSAEGCNKPSSRSAEKTVEVVRNHEGGTRLRDWHPGAEGWEACFPFREWTRSGDLARGLPPGRVDGGAKGRGAGASRFPWSNPMRGSRCEPGGAAGERSEVEPKEGSMTGPAAMRGR
jgi:hypothetical protein